MERTSRSAASNQMESVCTLMEVIHEMSVLRFQTEENDHR